LVVEDAAQGVMATYKGRPLGSFGHAAAISFHETKNVTSGEGGALLVNHLPWTERAEVIWEKGTNRSEFARGTVDKYMWLDLGSSYPVSEVSAAFLWAQLEDAAAITDKRLAVWRQYHQALAPFEAAGILRRPIVPPECVHNAHMYYLLVTDAADRPRLIRTLSDLGVNAVSHYVPLHASPAGRKFGKVSGSMDVTERISAQLVRLPMWFDMSEEDIAAVVTAIAKWAGTTGGAA
jgi:dTDP-4-amino-4,6-dideoxygalactose transaminase